METPKTSDFTGTIEAHDEEIVNLYWVKETIPADKTPPRTVFSSLSPLPLRSPSHTSLSVPPSEEHSVSLSSSVIDALNGIVELNAVRFERISLSDTPLLQISTEENAFKMTPLKYRVGDEEKQAECVFEDITRTVGE